jgi:hypothetical protein
MMIRTLTFLGIGCLMSMAAMAATCPLSGTGGTFIFDSVGNCGTNSSGVTFTEGTESITIFPEYVVSGTIKPNPDGPNNPVSGLFEVGQGQGGNIASGIGPYYTNEGGADYTTQLGIQESGNTDGVLYLEVSNASGVASGSTLSFLMQEGLTQDTFSVYTETLAAGSAPPNISSMTEVPGDSNVAVGGAGATSGRATTPQFSIVTSTPGTSVEFIAIQADCEYLLLNKITTTGPSSVPEPRFYGLLLASLLGLAGMVYQKRRTTRSNA